MNPLWAFCLLICITLCHSGHGAEVVRLEWKTKCGATPPILDQRAATLLPAFRLGLATLNESAVVQISLSQSGLLGLSEAQSAVLRPLVTERYRLIAESPAFSQATSLLADCYQEAKAVRGTASLYVPDKVSAASPVIVFLHGYGGSFLWYQHWFAEVFPDSIILCPAYGISPATIPGEYVREAVAAASKHLGFSLQPASLIGLSAGGFGACRLYAADPRGFSRLICMAGFPPEETIGRFKKDTPVYFIAGASEFFVLSGQLGRGVRSIQRNVPSAEMQAVPDGDHFFMLTHPEATRKILKRWLGTVPKILR